MSVGLITLGLKSEAIEASLKAHEAHNAYEGFNYFYFPQQDILDRYRSLVDSEAGIPDDVLHFSGAHFEDSGAYGRSGAALHGAYREDRLAIERCFEMWTEVKQGASAGGGDMLQDKRAIAEKLIEEFEANLDRIVTTGSIPRRLIRPLVIGSVICGLHADSYFVGYHPQLGIPSIVFMNLQITGVGRPNLAAFHSFLADRTGQDFAVVELQGVWLSLPPAQREANLTAVAYQLIQAELARGKVNTTMIPFNPIFGQNVYPVDEKRVFILMPFTNELTEIYNSIVKPEVESKNLVSRRADDISSNNAIMQDIWRNICEARFIIADITGRNPNVMYELGIAHTVGKEVIIIHQTRDDAKLPFDISHMRIITYDNTAIGGGVLKKKVGDTIDNVLQKLSASPVNRYT